MDTRTTRPRPRRGRRQERHERQPWRHGRRHGLRAARVLLAALLVGALVPAVVGPAQAVPKCEDDGSGSCPGTGGGSPGQDQARQCVAGSTGVVQVSSPTIAYGQGITVSWTVHPGAACPNGVTVRISGPGFDSSPLPLSGARAATPPDTSTWVLTVSSLSVQSQKSTARAAITVPPGSVTIDHSSLVNLFVDAINTPGEVVRIAGDVQLDLSGRESIPVEKGVQIIGDRSVNSSGPRIFTTTFPSVLLSISGDSPEPTRISGIRLDGGMSDDPFSAVDTPNANGIVVFGRGNVEIDHDEIHHFRGSAVAVHDGNDANDPAFLGRLNQDTAHDDTKNVRVHDNYIHHNQHPSANNCSPFGDHHAQGYGVEAADGAYVKIERNVFDWNRHAIAGDGKSGTGYLAYDNLILPDGGVHFRCLQPSSSIWGVVLNPFIGLQYVAAQALDPYSIYHTHAIDMHGVGNCTNGIFTGDFVQLGGYNCGQAGEYMDVEYNSILYTAGNAIHLRGTPVRAVSSPSTAKTGMDVKNNVFAHSVHDGGVVTPGAIVQNGEGSITESGNILGLNTLNDRKTCDFDGDGTPDSFLATGVTLWYASSRQQGRWNFLYRSPARVADVALDDDNGDGRCDVYLGNNHYVVTPPL